MSSGFAHVIVGAGIAQFGMPASKQKPAFTYWLWTGWLAATAMLPDLDYVIPALNYRAHDGIRVTHSVIICCIAPLITTLVLLFSKLPSRAKRVMAVQVFGSGLSHIVMDLLVSVTSFPLLWPLSRTTYKLPFGFLPSAPAYYLGNLYMYRNTFIEMAILIPALAIPYILLYKRETQSKRQQRLMFGLGCLFVIGFIWGASLAR